MSRPMLAESRTPRQKQFIDVAARLFAERSYHTVGINEISAALGLSGPAMYRHYPSKEALLIAVLDDVVSVHLEEIRDLVSATPDPEEALRAVADNHARFVLDQGENIITWRTEFPNLPEADRKRLRYLQRLYIEEWVRTLRKVRPDFDEPRARAICHGAIALIQSPTEFHGTVPPDQLRALLVSMALRAMDVPQEGLQ